MRYLSLFSGYGGFELGIQKAYASNQQSSEIKQDRKGRDGDSHEVADDVLSSSRTAPLCIGFSEIDKYASQVYQKHFPYEQCKRCSTKNEGQRVQGERYKLCGNGVVVSVVEEIIKRLL